MTARAEDFFVGRFALRDAVNCLQAYQEAGEDVFFAPGLRSTSDIATVPREIDRPLDVLTGFPGIEPKIPELYAIGVKRVTVGGSLVRAALGTLWQVGNELLEHGPTSYIDGALRGSDRKSGSTTETGLVGVPRAKPGLSATFRGAWPVLITE